MTTDYRAELQRLVQAYDEHGGKWPDENEQALFQAVEAARATLAQPGPEGVPPGYIDAEHTGRDREMLEAFCKACRSEGGTADEVHLRGLKAVLTRWGRPTIEPVPVAERLPLQSPDSPYIFDTSVKEQGRRFAAHDLPLANHPTHRNRDTAMTDQHRASPADWLLHAASLDDADSSCILELRAASAEVRPTVKDSLTDGGGLVERVADSLCCDAHLHAKARAAIREVAAWLREGGDYSADAWADMLEREADNG
jgi:hypothetical protein